MTRSRVEPLLARLDGVAWRLDASAHLDAAELDALAAEAIEVGRGAGVVERERIHAAVVRVREALARSSLHIIARMEALAVGRRAASAYARGRG